MSAAKGIYQIAAVKVRDGQITEEFQSLIRPWDGIADRKDAARKAKVELAVIESAEDVDQVIPKFFAFVGGDILVSTGAFGNQAKLLTRAARYAGMSDLGLEPYPRNVSLFLQCIDKMIDDYDNRESWTDPQREVLAAAIAGK